MFKAVCAFIGFIVVVIVLWYAFLGAVVYTGVQAVDKHGLKGVVDRVWCGKDRVACKE